MVGGVVWHLGGIDGMKKEDYADFYHGCFLEF
jgi:hypothetical protein